VPFRGDGSDRLDQMNVVIVSAEGGVVTQAVETGCRERFDGHSLECVDLVAEGFVPWMSAAERIAYHGDEPLIDPLARRSADLVRHADHLVLITTVTLGTVDPLLKGWLEKVMVKDVAFVFHPRTHKVQRGLTNLRSSTTVGIGTGPDTGARRTTGRALRLCTSARTSSRWIGQHAGEPLDGFGERAADAVVGHIGAKAGRR
jgi:putative NADPH-quinone reductase